MAVDWLRASCTYREIFSEGFDKGFEESYPKDRDDFQIACERGWLFFLGEEWLGHPSVEAIEKLEAISEKSKLEDLVRKLTDERRRISTWDELLAAR